MPVTKPRLTVTMQHLNEAAVSLPYDHTDSTGRRLVSLEIGTDDGCLVQFLDDIEHVAAIAHRADVLVQAALQTEPILKPAVTRDPAELAGEWVFTLRSAGHSQRLRLADLQELYRGIDTVLSEHRAAVTS